MDSSSRLPVGHSVAVPAPSRLLNLGSSLATAPCSCRVPSTAQCWRSLIAFRYGINDLIPTPLIPYRRPVARSVVIVVLWEALN